MVLGVVTPECDQGARDSLQGANLHSPVFLSDPLPPDSGLPQSPIVWLHSRSAGFLAHKKAQSHFHSPLGEWYILTSLPPTPPPHTSHPLSSGSTFLCLLFISHHSVFLLPPFPAHVSPLLLLYSPPPLTPPDAQTHTHTLSPAAPQSPLSSALLPGRWAGIQTICGARNKQEPGGCGVAAW